MATFRGLQLVRQFSSSASRAAGLVKTPIQVYGVEGRYASALYSAASKQKKLESVEKELASFQAQLQKDKKLGNYLTDPSQGRLDKKAAVDVITKKMKFSDLTVNLFSTLAENGRIGKIEQVLNSFMKLMSAHRGEVVCTVVTAKPLDDASSKELLAVIKSLIKKGETLQIAMEVDPSLIGGMKVTIGDRFIDMSMASKINTYTNLIKGSV